ncbi:MAG: ferrous iron transporter B [Clostridiales bacterium]|jgi:ferrous iron transport protein B|nr:ferrous iron transporter B [Clostridiales bacterium]
MKTVVLVGNPNVGKSALFYHLTRKYVTVSNYPGTTVEIFRGTANINGKVVEIVDTPGMYSLTPVTEEEAVTGRLLLETPPDLVIHIVDAKNLPRMLPLTLELLKSGFPVILVLNMMDEAEKLRVRILHKELSRRLGIPVLGAAFAEGRGIALLKKEINSMVCTRLGTEKKKRNRVSAFTGNSLENHREAGKILDGVFLKGTPDSLKGLEKLVLHPVGGLMSMALILYVGLYLIVGRFGAGYLVDVLEGTLFGQLLVPLMERWTDMYIPWLALRQLLAGDFGIMTLGLRYAFGIILPIVGTYFFVFAILEDSGYLPRLAFLADGWMEKVGLNGRAVIPLTLGFGCGTMAVLVTRTLESSRERIIVTFLLALAIPCSAQLGLIMAILASEPRYLFYWICIVGTVFLIMGALLNILLPGKRAPFFMELPPLRLPTIAAVTQKTLARMRWYFAEIIPVFILVSILLWLLGATGLLDVLSVKLTPVLQLMGLPPSLNMVFLYGFFRRDYGAAGLYDLYRSGTVSGGQLLVAAVVLTLFLPCLAQLAVMIRERGLAVSAVIVAAVAMIAVIAGIVINMLVSWPQL